VRKEGMPALVREFAVVLKEVESFEPEQLEAAAKAFCEAKAVKIGDLNHALRVATTGVMVGPGLFDILAILGREETLTRIDAALQLRV
jgi:glutamyl-tRNA synthetase